jgi:hypothetical protein
MECQICLVCEGKHKESSKGICGEHAEKIKELLEWWEDNKKVLKKKFEK